MFSPPPWQKVPQKFPLLSKVTPPGSEFGLPNAIRICLPSISANPIASEIHNACFGELVEPAEDGSPARRGVANANIGIIALAQSKLRTQFLFFKELPPRKNNDVTNRRFPSGATITGCLAGLELLDKGRCAISEPEPASLARSCPEAPRSCRSRCSLRQGDG